MNYEVLGWISAWILAIQLTPFAIRWLLKFKLPFSDYLKKLRALTRMIHKPLGLLLLIIPAFHGYMALGAFRLHTGTLVGMTATAAVLSGIGFHYLKKKSLLTWHRGFAITAGFLLTVHLLKPWLLG